MKIVSITNTVQKNIRREKKNYVDELELNIRNNGNVKYVLNKILERNRKQMNNKRNKVKNNDEEEKM